MIIDILCSLHHSSPLFIYPKSLSLAKKQTRPRRMVLKTQNIQYMHHRAPRRTTSVSILLFCFQLCAREYGAPKCGDGCFQVVIWHTPLFSPLIPLCVGRLRLSLVVNHELSLEETCTGAKNVFLAYLHLKIRLKSFSGFLSTMRTDSLSQPQINWSWVYHRLWWSLHCCCVITLRTTVNRGVNNVCSWSEQLKIFLFQILNSWPLKDAHNSLIGWKQSN